MKQRWNFRCYPTAEQEQVLARTFGCTRFVYNRFLRRVAALKSDPAYSWLREVSSVPAQQA